MLNVAGENGTKQGGTVLCKILLAEDCPDTVQLLQTYLSDPRVAITVTTKGREAVAAFQKESFDLVLMDIELPEMDGYTATREIRKWETSQMLPKTPIAALTGLSDFHASTDILAAGCTLHLVKPIARQTLMQIVSQYGSPSGKRREKTPPARPALASEEARLAEGSIDDAVRALAPEYLTHLNQNLAEMKVAMQSRQYTVVKTFAHQMKGSGSAFGFSKVTEYGREIERAAAKSDQPTMAQQLSNLSQYLSQVTAEWSFSVQAR